MSRLSPPVGGANKSASIPSPDSAEDAFSPSIVGQAPPSSPPLEIPPPPLIMVNPTPPPIEFPEDASSALEEPLPPAPDLQKHYNTRVFRNASRRAAHLLRAHLQGIGDEQVWLVGFNRKGLIIGSACIAEGGLERARISLPDLL